jgi:HSP20 family molecular chaperone IbpA
LKVSSEKRDGSKETDRVVLQNRLLAAYYREISLHQVVKGPLTNATYGNGALVLSMPKGEENEIESEVNFQLHSIAATRGE